MKKYIMAVVIAVCLALCAAVLPQGEVAEETPKPTQITAVNTPEVPVVAPKEAIEILPQTETENTEPPQLEPPTETVPEPEVTPTATPVVPEVKVQLTPEPKTTPEPSPNPVPAQAVVDPQPGDMVYVPGFGWLESQGEGMVIHDDMMYENGNKVGIMGSSE